jgi:hypothetical protein
MNAEFSVGRFGVAVPASFHLRLDLRTIYVSDEPQMNENKTQKIVMGFAVQQFS